MTKELDKAMLTPEEILAAPSGETVYNDDGSMDIRASRLNREIEIAKAQLAKAIPIIAKARDIEWIKALLKESIMVAKPDDLKGIHKRLETDTAEAERKKVAEEITFDDEDVHIFDTSYGYNQVRIDHVFLNEGSILWQTLKSRYQGEKK